MNFPLLTSLMKMRTLDKFNLGIVILILSSSFLSHNANNVICKTLDKINIDKRFLYYEEIHVEVYANGSISVWVESLVKNSFFNTSDAVSYTHLTLPTILLV